MYFHESKGSLAPSCVLVQLISIAFDNRVFLEILNYISMKSEDFLVEEEIWRGIPFEFVL